jgi:F-type H+-transporting ATPase subunit epsilon
MNIKIVSPERVVYEENDFDSITLTTAEGEITILPGHVPLVAKVSPGEIIIKKDSKEISLVTTEGFLRLEKDGNILLLTDYAIRSEEIEIAKIIEAKRKAEDAMKEKKTEYEFVMAEAELRRTLLELKVARKRGLSSNQRRV